MVRVGWDGVGANLPLALTLSLVGVGSETTTLELCHSMSCTSSDRHLHPSSPPTVRHKPTHRRIGSVPASSENAMLWADGNIGTEDEEGHTGVRRQSSPEGRLHHQTYPCPVDLPRLLPLTPDELEWAEDDVDVEEDDRESTWWFEVGRRGSHDSSCYHLAQDEEDDVSLSSLQRRSSHHGHVGRRQEREEGGWTGFRRVLSCLSLYLPHCEKERPVRRILRPPRRRQTMRGLSGLPIEAANQWTTTTTLDG